MENTESISMVDWRKEGIYVPSEPTEKMNKLGHCLFFHLAFLSLWMDHYCLTREFVPYAFTLLS